MMKATVSYLLVPLKVKGSDLPFLLCLGNISRDFTANNMKETGLNGFVCNFLVIIMLLTLMKLSIFISI